MVDSSVEKAAAEVHARISVLKRETSDASETVDNKLQQLQRAQIYLEQKLKEEIAAGKAELEEKVSRCCLFQITLIMRRASFT